MVKAPRCSKLGGWEGGRLAKGWWGQSPVNSHNSRELLHSPFRYSLSLASVSSGDCALISFRH